MAKFTYKQAVAIRALAKELKNELPETIKEASETKTIVQIAKDLRYNRSNIYHILNGKPQPPQV